MCIAKNNLYSVNILDIHPPLDTLPLEKHSGIPQNIVIFPPALDGRPRPETIPALSERSESALFLREKYEVSDLDGPMGSLAPGAVTVATTHRNFPGRLGHPTSKV